MKPEGEREPAPKETRKAKQGSGRKAAARDAHRHPCPDYLKKSSERNSLQEEQVNIFINGFIIQTFQAFPRPVWPLH